MAYSQRQSAQRSVDVTSAAPPSSLLTGGTAMVGGRPAKTPIGYLNNGVHINGASGANAPTIFAMETAQVLHLPSRGGDILAVGATSSDSRASLGRHGLHAAGAKHPSASELLFGGRPSDGGFKGDTTSLELSHLQIVSMRQLQRALQHKITQSTRNPTEIWHAFTKFDRRKRGHLNLADLIVAVRGFNLVASDELVAQLQALDRDHDGELSLTEFVNGLRADNHGGAAVLLQEQPDYKESSRRHFGRSLKFHHPLHNVMHLSGDPRF